MKVVVLAAGFGTRLRQQVEEAKKIPKALMPLKNGCVLDSLIKALWVPGITCIEVVHNAAPWSKTFQSWKRNYTWNSTKAKRQDAPYIKLFSNQARTPQERHGIVGDLALVVSHFEIEKSEPGVVVVCGDNLFKPIDMGALAGETSAITVRNENALTNEALSGSPTRVNVEAGFLRGFKSMVESPWRFCGPAFLCVDDFYDLFDYVRYHKTASVLPDDLGGFFTKLAEKKKVRAIKETDAYFLDVGTASGYRQARAALSGRKNG